ncbi:MAG TPA: YdeI/OmpD-associated family protein [Candidatus Saccharimonadales bacterium]|nr:YdeI/OmpD-associated family protein [Candidatus Saccharimonadales bacterium]
MTKVYKNPGPIKFSAIIQRNTDIDNSSAWINFPYDLKETYGVGNLVPFKATFDGRVVYRGSIAKMGGPSAMILLRKDVRAELDKQPGEKVEVVVELDDKPREINIAYDIKKSLKAAGLWEKFDKLAYTHRKEYVQWIEEAKKPETRVSRIQKMCEMLAAGKTRP